MLTVDMNNMQSIHIFRVAIRILIKFLYTNFTFILFNKIALRAEIWNR